MTDTPLGNGTLAFFFFFFFAILEDMPKGVANLLNYRSKKLN